MLCSCSQSDRIYPDFAKAIDTVPHNSLVVDTGTIGEFMHMGKELVTENKEPLCIAHTERELKTAMGYHKDLC